MQIIKKLSLDEREQVQEILDHETMPALLKLIEEVVKDMEQDVIRRHLDEGVDKLVHTKLRAEGARKLLTVLLEVKKARLGKSN